MPAPTEPGEAQDAWRARWTEQAVTLAELHARVAELEAGRARMRRRIWTLVTDRRTAREIRTTMQTNLAWVRSERDQARVRVARLETERANAHARATAAEAQVAAVREALDELAAEADKRRGGEIQAAERAGLIMAITGIREALDAASTPAEPGISSAAPSASAPPHAGQDCPDRIEVTGWGMTDRE